MVIDADVSRLEAERDRQAWLADVLLTECALQHAMLDSARLFIVELLDPVASAEVSSRAALVFLEQLMRPRLCDAWGQCAARRLREQVVMCPYCDGCALVTSKLQIVRSKWQELRRARQS